FVEWASGNGLKAGLQGASSPPSVHKGVAGTHKQPAGMDPSPLAADPSPGTAGFSGTGLAVVLDPSPVFSLLAAYLSPQQAFVCPVAASKPTEPLP
ncbi:MAG: hypothetical protein FWE65_02750, partial [Eggerthellaceae bacterium]|nr:hypothetical protein [Eggerthellaceae bacterium]